MCSCKPTNVIDASNNTTPVPKPRSKQLAEGCLSQIQLYQTPVEAATDALDMKLVQGAKDETSLQPLMTGLEKAMEDFSNALRPIRALLETVLAISLRSYHGVLDNRPSKNLDASKAEPDPSKGNGSKKAKNKNKTQ